MKMPQMPKGNNGGFTLVELLVVILIIVILSVTMLPLLKPFVTKAQYAAEGVPVIGNLRTKVEVFRIEKDYLPGVPVGTDNKPVKIPSTGWTTSGMTNGYTVSDLVVPNLSTFAAANVVQYMTMTTNLTTGKQLHKYWSGATELNDASGNPVTGVGKLSDHVFNKIDINYSDLTGRRLRPHHVKYAVVGSSGESYLWVVACFGNGDGLAAGCGYAVAEYNDIPNQRKFVATFERYKPMNDGQLGFSITAITPGTKWIIDNPGSVWLPEFETLVETSSSSVKYGQLLEGMRLAGWEVN